MGSEVTPEPIDFDFFAEDDEDIRSGRNSAHRSSPQVTTKGRPVSASSGRSAGSSRSSLSVKIPSAGPTGVRENAYNAKSRYSDSSDEDNYAGKESRNRHGNKAEINRNAVIKENGNRPNVSPTPRSSGSEGTEGVSRKMPASSRPKTSKGPHTRKRHESSSSNESRSLKSRHSSSSSSSESGHSDSYTSVSDSDSDVTDVSPLPSPARSPIPRLEYDQDEFEDSFEESRFRQAKDQSSSVNNRDGKHNVNRSRKKETVRFSGVTPSIGPTSQRDKKFDETEARELSRLLRAVLELEETPNCSQLNSFHKSTMKQRPWSAKRAATAMPHQRVNLSFSNDKVRQIDRENQRLLHKILHRPKSAVSESGMASMRKRDDPPKMMSHSAIRRQREQRKIDMENRVSVAL